MRTQVAIIGAGPAGLVLSQLLHRRGIDSIVLERRSRAEVEATVRAGVLEQGTVEVLADCGAGERLAREAFFHRGILLRFGGATHRIDVRALTGGKHVTIYPQHEVLKDLIALRVREGGKLVFDAQDVRVDGVGGQHPRVTSAQESIDCDFVAGCDGSHGLCRTLLPPGAHARYERTYPFAWLGMLVEAPRSSEELVYASHEHGFALLSTRTPTLQRMYLQCEPQDRPENWTDDRIWQELHARLHCDGWTLAEGRITQKVVVPMHSLVIEPMQHGRLFLAGDAAHVVPPTGAKGLNLAVADARVLAHAIGRFYAGDAAALERYSAMCLPRAWAAQRFSWWMTTLLHRPADEPAFDTRRRMAELAYLVRSPHAAAALAENYAGLPLQPLD